MKLRKFDLIPGTDFDGLIIGIVGLALLYVGTGGWVADRWKEAASTAGPAAAGLIFGKRKGEKEGFEHGYNTYNPRLHIDELLGGRGVADAVGGAVAGAVADQVADAAIDHIAGALPDFGDVDPIDPRSAFTGKQDKGREKRKQRGKDELPPGWHRDEAGHLRDEHGRYASNRAAERYWSER